MAKKKKVKKKAKKKTKKKVKRAPAKKKPARKKPAPRKPATKKAPVKKMAKAKAKKLSLEDGSASEVRLVSTKDNAGDTTKNLNELLADEEWSFVSGPTDACPFFIFAK